MKYSIVKNEINRWDPIELLAVHTPSDEYEREIELISNRIEGILNKEQIQKIIYEVFLNCFDCSVFSKSYDDCFEVALNIYRNLYKESAFSAEHSEGLGAICFHDAELKSIITDYYNHKVECPLIIDPIGQKRFHALLRFIDIIHIDIDVFEPWGHGFYINDVDFICKGSEGFLDDDRITNDYFLFNIQLNSGDNINIFARQLMYIEEIYK